MTLEAQVNPEGVETTFHFEYVDDAQFKAEGGFASSHTVKTEESASIGEEFQALPVSFEVPAGQLTPGTLYDFRVVATNANAPGGVDGEDAQASTLPPAAIDSTYATEVTSDAAVLDAQVNPLGDETSFHFEYLPESQFQAHGFAGAVSAPVPDRDLGAGQADVLASALVQGLQPGTAYRYRLVAHNEHEGVPYTVEGPAGSFTTQGAGGSALPDGRQWELVSPPDKLGALIEPLNEEPAGVIQAAAGGDALTYHTDLPTEHGVEGNLVQVQVLSRRTPAGWQTRDIAIPHPVPTGLPVNTGQDYRFFSEDLSQALVQPIGEFKPSLSPEASEQTAYLRSDYLNGNVTEPCLPASMHCYRPLVTGAAGFANVPEGFHFGEEGRCPSPEQRCGPRFVGSSPDGAHVVMESSQLTETPAPGGSLYEWSAGKLALVSVLPGEGEVAATPPLNFGSSHGIDGMARHAVSGDGSRVFWSETLGLHRLFMRDMLRKETIEIGGEGASFEGANGEGSRVFFNGQVCEVKLDASTEELECVITDLGGPVVASSEDGSYVYVNAAAGIELRHYDGEAGHQGWEPPRLVAPGSADPAGQVAEGKGADARVSPDGRWLAFMSSLRLTGYDNTDLSSGQADQEVYLYDSQTGRLACASCEPSGARPVGVEANSGTGAGGTGAAMHNAPLIDAEAWGNSWIAANVPGLTNYDTNSRGLYQSRYLSNEGRLFFNSRDGLVPHDKNNNWDVYEYQPAGTGPEAARCGPSSASGTIAYKPARTYEGGGGNGEEPAGCVGLISAGSSSDESAFLDASENGSDVFFLTTSRLSTADFDNGYDIYDAHECTTASPCLPQPATTPPPCASGDACKPPATPQPPIYGPPASATFTGPGNPAPPPPPKGKTAAQIRAEKLQVALKLCRRKHNRPNRQKCEKQAKKKYGAVKASARKSARKAGKR
jgi:hypothetical protein